MWVLGVARFSAFTGAAVVGPGIAFFRAAGVRLEPALVLPIGGALAALAYWVALAGGHPAGFLGLVLLLNAPLLLRRPRAGSETAEPSLRGALPAIATTLLFLAFTQYLQNRQLPSGEFALDPLVTSDTAFHVGLTRELAIGYPPQVPGLAGFPLRYHLGLDLLRAAALRFASVDPYDSISRFDVTLWAIALILALRSLTYRLGAPPLAVQLVGFAPLATDFSFVFAGNPQAHWWCDLLSGNVLMSVAFANPVVPALALALGTLVALSRWERDGGSRWLVVAALPAVAVAFFKVFLGAQLALGLAVAAALSPARRRPYALLATLAAGSTAVLASGAGASTVSVAIAPFDLARITRATLSLPPVTGFAFAAWAALWVTASLGLRWMGIGPALAALRARSGGPGAALATMALCAWPIGLTFRIAPLEAVAGQKPINDVFYLVEQGGLLLWIFTALSLAHTAKRMRRVPLLAAVALLTLPATVQFALKKATQRPDAIPAGAVRGMEALAAESHPGEVVMQRPGMRYPAPPLVLLGLRVPYERFTPYLTQFATRAALEERHELVYRFFHTEDTAEAESLARTLDARYLCLYDTDRVRFDLASAYDPVYEDAEARVYRRRPQR
jgi:hypothetical protein